MVAMMMMAMMMMVVMIMMSLTIVPGGLGHDGDDDKYL